MSAETHCPKCPSVNVIFSKKRSIYVCEDCGHSFAREKPSISLRIFLSYGHDANEELVRRIKSELEKRGHDVWFHTFVELLAHHAPRLPDWFGLVVTSRPESAVQTPLQGLNPFVLDTRTEVNRDDLRDYLGQKNSRRNSSTAPAPTASSAKSWTRAKACSSTSTASATTCRKTISRSTAPDSRSTTSTIPARPRWHLLPIVSTPVPRPGRNPPKRAPRAAAVVLDCSCSRK